jgi:hypothetical protein
MPMLITSNSIRLHQNDFSSYDRKSLSSAYINLNITKSKHRELPEDSMQGCTYYKLDCKPDVISEPSNKFNSRLTSLVIPAEEIRTLESNDLIKNCVNSICETIVSTGQKVISVHSKINTLNTIQHLD